MTQAYDVLRELDPEATITVWTWAEDVPELFGALPGDVRAAHIRHGMGGMFDDIGAGREQPDGRPDISAERRWLSGQFTLFSGNETLVRTAWSDAAALRAAARAAAADPTCEGYFQWPEWTATSPWLSEVIARLAWDPDGFEDGFEPDGALARYARARHGNDADLVLRGFRPLFAAGAERIMVTPRKRVVRPYLLSADELSLLAAVRDGVRDLWRDWPASSTRLLQRDFCDLVNWTAVRQAQVFEAAAYVGCLVGDRSAVQPFLAHAFEAWDVARALLAQVPELTILGAARRMAETAPLADGALDTFWVQACDFYKGYPLVLGPESVELVFVEQSRRFGAVLDAALDTGTPPSLPAPGFFWHDFPDPTWADLVVGMPPEDSASFESAMRDRLAEAFRLGRDARGDASLAFAVRDLDPMKPLAAPTVPSAIPDAAFASAVAALLEPALPEPLAGPDVVRWRN